MRGRVWLLAALLALMCACAASAEPDDAAAEASVTAGEIARQILDSQEETDGLSLLPEEEQDFYLAECYGLEEGSWSEAAIYAANGVDAREIAVLRLSGGEDSETAAAALEKYRQSRMGDFFGYAPEQAALLEQAAVVYSGRYAALLVCQDAETARAAFEACTGETAAGPPETTAVPVLNPDLDTRWFIPFDPPNAFDMSLYDTSGIVAAWTSGDESGLSRKDAAILARCREIFAECVTEEMSAFEKELALHDYLVDWGSYDETVYDAHTPLGREDNTNPYGMLVEGYGICLGYATSFQLLMELADVECITVVGASRESREDHAWNMVKLEGEWYCVDPTWDGADMSHRYFNVTSARMRATNHQWDYRNVPEATATRFFWDGTGVLPA